MKRTFIAAALAASTLVSACATTPTAVVSGYNGATVNIQVPQYVAYLPKDKQDAFGQQVKNTALQVCAADGHTSVQYLSIRAVNDYTAEALFLCR